MSHQHILHHYVAPHNLFTICLHHILESWIEKVILQRSGPLFVQLSCLRNVEIQTPNRRLSFNLRYSSHIPASFCTNDAQINGSTILSGMSNSPCRSIAIASPLSTITGSVLNISCIESHTFLQSAYTLSPFITVSHQHAHHIPQEQYMLFVQEMLEPMAFWSHLSFHEEVHASNFSNSPLVYEKLGWRALFIHTHSIPLSIGSTS